MRKSRQGDRRRVLRPSSPPAAGLGVAVPFVAIVGRPNVGKSTLFNRLMNRRISIVERTAGTTRDRISALLALEDGRRVELCDTGGLGGTDDPHDKDVDRQIELALERADLVLFVLDSREGALPLDEEIARRLHKLKRPVILVANKAETQQLEDLSQELWRLGCGEPVPVSAKEGLGRQKLLERIAHELDAKLAAAPAGEETPVLGGMPEAPRELRIAVVGRRNAGKSSYVNALFGAERVIVSERPGTTRDAIDVRVVVDGEPVVMIDTAGLRKRGRADDAIELISHGRAREAIRRCDVALVLLDSLRDLSEVDKKIVDLCVGDNKAIVLVPTKWDLVQDDMTPEQFSDYVRKRVPTVPFAPICLISSTEGINVTGPVEIARELYKRSMTRVPTAKVNRAMHAALVKKRPRIQGNVTPKIYFSTQVAVNPVTIVTMCNKPSLFDIEYRRYLCNQLRETLPFAEIPIKLVFRERRGLIERGLAGRLRDATALEKTRRWLAGETDAVAPDEVAAELDQQDVRSALAAEVAEEEAAAARSAEAVLGEGTHEDDAPAPPRIDDLLYGEDADVVRSQIQAKRSRRGKGRRKGGKG